MLEADGVKVELYYETKSNLRKDQLIALKRIGTNWIPAGYRKLGCTHVLRLMDKGVSAIQNVQLLEVEQRRITDGSDVERHLGLSW